MGDPFLIAGKTTVRINGFFYNVAMTVFREDGEKHASEFPANSVVPRLVDHIRKFGCEHIADTVFRLDDFTATEDDRLELRQWFAKALETVCRPGFQLPESWRKVLTGSDGQPILITSEHTLGLAYAIATMIRMIDGTLGEGTVERRRRPENWSPECEL